MNAAGSVASGGTGKAPAIRGVHAAMVRARSSRGRAAATKAADVAMKAAEAAVAVVAGGVRAGEVAGTRTARASGASFSARTTLTIIRGGSR